MSTNAPRERAQSSERPNVLYIHSDQHSPYVLGCYGDPIVKTPHLDGLAKRGVVFDGAYCPSPLCGPSRMATLTGRYPYETEVWTNQHILSSQIPTLAHAWGAAGYEPVLVGRLHSVGCDQLRGYAARMVGDHVPNYPGGRPVDRGILDGAQDPGRISLERSGVGLNAYQVHDEDVTAAAVRYLNDLGSSRASGRTEPFSLSVGFMLPHQPYVAERGDFDLYRNAVGLPDHPEPFSKELHPYLRWWREKNGIEHVMDEEIVRARAAYWGLVTRLDSMIGEILNALRQNGLEENTLILYTSDHGDHVGEHGLWWKQSFYEEAVRIPGIMVWPGVLSEGVRCRRVVSSLDFNATMLAATGAPSLPGSHGRDLLPLLTSKSRAWEDIAFAEYCTDEGWCQRMVRRDDWKLNYYFGHRPQLFNLADDPHELNDRGSDPECREVREELVRIVKDGWDPELIAHKMQQKREELDVLRGWAACLQPEDECRWEMRAEMNRLDPNDPSRKHAAE